MDRSVSRCEARHAGRIEATTPPTTLTATITPIERSGRSNSVSPSPRSVTLTAHPKTTPSTAPSAVPRQATMAASHRIMVATWWRVMPTARSRPSSRVRSWIDSEIELAIADFGKRANEGRLSIEEMQGGTFTISNGGVYGSLLSTPIVNPPQSGVLGMHNIVDRPVVVNGEIVVRPMMYLALTYDHRVVDGREAVSFLKRIKDVVEDPTRLILEI